MIAKTAMASAGSGATVVTRATAVAGHRAGQVGEGGGRTARCCPLPFPLPLHFPTHGLGFDCRVRSDMDRLLELRINAVCVLLISF